MIWKTRCLALLALLQRFLKHQATIGEVRALVRKLKQEIREAPEQET